MEDQTNNPTASEVKAGKIVETTKNGNEQSSGTNEIVITRGKYSSITLYEITEDELGTLKRGSPTSIYLNFAIFLLSIATAFLINLKTSTHQSTSIEFVVFTIICVVGYLLGIILFVIWYRNKGDMKALCEKIEERIA